MTAGLIHNNITIVHFLSAALLPVDAMEILMQEIRE